MTVITLKEYETFPSNQGISDPVSLKHIRGLKLEEQDKKLKKELQKNILSINVDPFQEGLLQFKAYSHIGVAQFTNFSISITPKFSEIGKLIELIDYVYDLDLEIFPESESKFEGERHMISEIIITTFVKKCQKLIRQGLFKSYNNHEDDLPFLRGKLLVSQQIRNQANTKLQFSCKYDEFEYNNLDNQIILYCLRRIYYLTINEKRKKEIRILIQEFSDLVDDIGISSDDFAKINYNQMNSHYKKIHELCRLIIGNIQITNFYKQKLRFINSFFIDMNIVFEKFIFKLFAEFYPLHAKDQESDIAWKTENEGKTIQSITDILIFEKDQNTVHTIIDTKYKTDLTNADRYQLEHYIHDHKKTEAYVILPEFKDAKYNSYIATRQDIQIKVRHVNIDKVLEYINLKDPRSKKDKIKELLIEVIPL